MTITKEMAELMDRILTIAMEGKRIVNMPEPDKNKDLYISIGHALERCNYGKWLSGGTFMVFPEGITFIRSDSFIERMKKYHAENEKKQANEDAQAKLTLFQLESAKRERKLWIWGIISTIINIILAVFQLLNP